MQILEELYREWWSDSEWLLKLSFKVDLNFLADLPDLPRDRRP